jgi:nitronate monooxygenase
MALTTDLSQRLGLRLPLLLAPMAGGPSTVDLVAAGCEAGILGGLGFAYAQPDAMRRDCEAVRARTSGPININLFTAPQPDAIPEAAQQPALDALAALSGDFGLPAPTAAKPPYAPDLEAQLAAVESIRPEVFSFHLGELPAARIRHLQSLGVRVAGSATCVAEARRLESLGVDFIIAQGGEAGGHRGSYLRDPYQSMTGTLALTRLLVCAVKLPVVAAGGIMDGAGVAAVLALGAQAAQLGTAFLACPESGASVPHKAALLAAEEDTTRVTEKFSGKPARGLDNRFMRDMAGAPQLAFPAQNVITGPVRTASAKAGRPDAVAMWAGQAAPLTRALPAAELIARIEAETLDALDRLASLRR